MGFGAANMFYDPADLLLITGLAFRRMAALSCALDVNRITYRQRRSAAESFQLEAEMSGKATRSLAVPCADQAGATDVILDIKRLLLSPGNTSIPENIVGQSLSVGFRPLPQTTPLL